MSKRIKIEKTVDGAKLVVKGSNWEIYDFIVKARLHETQFDEFERAIGVQDWEIVDRALHLISATIDDSVYKWLNENAIAYAEYLAEKEREQAEALAKLKAEEAEEEKRQQNAFHAVGGCRGCQYFRSVADDHLCVFCDSIITHYEKPTLQNASMPDPSGGRYAVMSILPQPYPIAGCAWEE